MAAFLQTVLTTSMHGSIVILAVLLLRLVLRKAPKKVYMSALDAGRNPSVAADSH